MNTLKTEIELIAREIAESKDFFLIETAFRGNDRNRIIEIYVDGEKNITAEDCAEISRAINDKIEENNLITSSYRLDVSSPGVDRPLIYLRQFPKHINRKFELEYLAGDELKKNSGRLLRIEGEDLIFQNKNEEILINFNNIKKTTVVISFS